MPVSDLSTSTHLAGPFTVTAPGHTTPAPHASQLGKVLHVINGEHFSGAERVQQLLGKRLAQFGYEAEFACVKPGRFPQMCGLRDSQVSQFPMTGRFDLAVVQKLARKVTNESFHLLHAHTPRTALITSLVALRSGVPWVYHVHSPTSRDSTRGAVNRVNQLIEHFAVRSCHRLVTVSKSLRREMLKGGMHRSRLAVIPNGVPPIEPIEAVLRLDARRWRLGMVALMRPRKGVEVALAAMHELKSRGAPVELDLIGGFESDLYQRQILALIRSLKLEDAVRWTGFTQDVSSAIRQLDGLLLPSLFGEGMPMVVLEALAAAVPVVATRVEGTPEVIRDGVEGLLAEPHNVSSLTEKIVELTRCRHAWQQMSHRALARHRETFTDERMAERVAREYTRVLESCR